MGSFSFTRATLTTRRANFTEGDRYKILIPKHLGGGYIVDTYYDYGYVFTDKSYNEDGVVKMFPNSYYVDGNGVKHTASEFPECDLYGILAYMNGCAVTHLDGYKGDGTMLDILMYGDTTNQENRVAGIHIGCYIDQINNLEFPLKMVSMSYKGTYEDCTGRSYGDPNQGFRAHSWEDKYGDIDPDYSEIVDFLNSEHESVKTT